MALKKSECGYSRVEREKARKFIVGFGFGVGFRILFGTGRECE